jgi:PAS domain S-box-containing protein
MNLITKLQIRYSLIGSIVVPIIGRIALSGTGHAGDLYRYVIPALVGCAAGFLIGRVQGKQRELAESKRYLKAILDNTPAPIYLKDSEGRYLLINRQFEMLAHIPLKEIIGKNDFDVFPEHIATLFRSQDEEVKNRNVPVEFEETVLLKDGEHTFITSKFPLHDADRNIYAVGGFCTDITIRKQAEEQKRELEARLLQAQKMEAIGTLAGGIAHDLNNILMGIQGYASLMLLHIDSSHPHYNRLTGIKNQVQSGARLTSYLLGYARKGRYEVKPISLNALMEEISDTFGRTRRGATIHRVLAEELFPIEADRGQIEQVLLNLFVNAADAMPGGGNIILKTMNVTHEDMKGKLYEPKQGKYVLLTVTDTGTGMDKETIERIFDPFFTTKEMGLGTGLGLASAYGIIKGHGGYIDVESKKGHGTTFSVYLPASEKKVPKTVKTADRVVKGTGTILLVDDEEVILKVGKYLLVTMGYQVLIARDGKEAIEVYNRNQHDINMVLLDMIMPGMGGGEAYDRMKEIDPDLKVLLSSGYSIDGEATKILKRGCNGFLQKPFNMEELSVKIREILDKK